MVEQALLKLFKILLVTAVLACCAFGYYIFWYVSERIVPFPSGKSEIVLKVEKGASIKSIIDEMNREGLDIHPDLARLAFKFFDADKSVHVGWYLLEEHKTLKDIVLHLASGDVIMDKVTFIEGTTTQQFIDKLNGLKDVEHGSEPINLSNVMEKAGAPKGTHPEGQLAPDTYVYAAGSSVDTILKSAYNLQKSRLKKAWEQRDKSIAVKNPYQLLIMASIIEKETGHKNDRELVSSVFNNRLKKNMLLQTDPTVVYGIKDFQGKILRSHLNTDHPYNTYIRPGLPPTPIANPGLASLQAASHPAKTDFLYFVAMGEGKSYFSKSLREHNAAVQKYLRSKGK